MPKLNTRKRTLAAAYVDAVAGQSLAQIVREPDYGRSNYWLNGFLLHEEYADLRDPLLAALNSAGLNARPVWTLMHKLPAYSSCPRMALDFAEDIERRLVNIPSSPGLVKS